MEILLHKKRQDVLGALRIFLSNLSKEEFGVNIEAVKTKRWAYLVLPVKLYINLDLLVISNSAFFKKV